MLKRELGILGDIHKYNSNENPLGPSSRAIEALKQALGQCHLYPDDSQCNLKDKLSVMHHVPRERIIIGNGSVELILLVGLAYLSDQDNIILSDPSFIMPKIVAQIVGCKTKIVPTRNYTHDLQAMLDAVDDSTKIIYIDNPNNPTGTYNTAQQLDRFFQQVPEHILVILDEAYYEYAQGNDCPNACDYLAAKKNVLVLRTFSKIYGLAGLRIGYGISGQQIIDSLMKVRIPFNVNRLAHVSACVALDDQQHVERSRNVNEQGKDRLYTAFGAMGLDFQKSKTNFILVHFDKSANEVFSALQKHGIITRTCLEYGLEKSLRITVSDEERNEKLVQTLLRVL